MKPSDIDPEEAQKITINSYNQHIAEYIAKRTNNNSRTLAFWPGIAYFLTQLSPGQVIFEIGSGFGIDAETIEKLGFQVRRSDATEAFIKLLKDSGKPAVFYDVLKRPISKRQSAILANAVLLHFSKAQFELALHNIRASLTDSGLVCLGMKLGDFEGWREIGLSGKRYFKFWKLTDLETELRSSGFEVLHSFVTADEDFCVITARKLSK